jgi:hypothetical protein
MVDRRGAFRVLMGKSEGRRPFAIPDVYGTTTLKLIMKKSVARAWTGLIWLRIGTCGGLL